MKNLVLSLLASLCLIDSSTLLARDLYVAQNGNDSSTGSTISSPFKTLGKAALEARPGDTVWIREGTYQELLKPARSGTAAAPIVFRSYQNEKVIITAMQALTEWTRDSGSVYRTTVDWNLGQENMVMRGSTVLDLARWPNNIDGDPFTPNTVRNTGGSGPTPRPNGQPETLEYNPNDATERFPNLDWSKGGSIYFYGDKPGSGWLAYKERIVSNTRTEINFNLDKIHSWIFGAHSPAEFGEFYLEGVRGALDYQNEWFLDADRNTLYVQLPEGAPPIDGEVLMRRRTNTIDLSGRSYIHIENLAVFGGSIDMGGNAHHNRIYKVSSFYGNYTRGIFRDFESRLGSINMGYNSYENLVEHSEVGYGAATGIRDNGDRNSILNSYIHNFNFLGSYDAPLVVRDGNDGIVRNNTITRGGRDTVRASNNGLDFSYNDVSYSNLIADDCALYYSVGGPQNAEIHHNWFHDAYANGSKRKAAGIYLDTNPDSSLVHHNVIWNTEWSNIQMNWNAKDIQIYNNTFINGEVTMGAWHRAGTAFSNINVWNNLSDQNQWEPQSNRQNNVSYTQDPFVNRNAGDFRLNAETGAQAINQGRVITGITDNVLDGQPDVGAYELGDNWVAGIDWTISEGAANRCYNLPGESCGDGVPDPDPNPDPDPDPTDNFIRIPSKIQAEDYASESGTRTLATTDNGGGDLVGYIDEGDYLEFDVDVTRSGMYEWTSRLASFSQGGVVTLFSSDGDVIGSARIGNTGGWQQFVTTSETVNLSAGRQRLRMSFSSPNINQNLLNANWFEFRLKPTASNNEESWTIIPLKNGKMVILPF